MLQHWKTLAIALSVALLVFAVSRPVFVRFMDDKTFVRRRNVWIVLTLAAFLSPSFWVLAAIALPLLWWATSKDENPLALYLLLLYAVPPTSLDIPFAGLNKLFELSTYRILSLGVLVPFVFGIGQGKNPDRRGLDSQSIFLIAYLVLVLVLQMPLESITNTMRRAVILFLDFYVIYHAFSRLQPDRRRIADIFATLAMAAAVMAPMAVFENLSKWLLYADIGSGWGAGIDSYFAYLMRGDSLRAQVSAGHALTLGYFLAMGFGAALFMRASLQVGGARGWVIAGWMWMGLLASLSRGPWLSAVLVMMVFLMLSPNGSAAVFKALVVAALGGCALLVSPWGEKVIDLLPFVGSVDKFNVDYRQELFDTSIRLIQVHPLLGDPMVLLNMENLRQGEGIIDLMNGYLEVALFNGLIGLFLFLCPVFISAKQAVQTWAAGRGGDLETTLIGATLLGCLAGTLLFVATATYGPILFVLAGLMSVYARLEPRTVSVLTPRPAVGASRQQRERYVARRG